MTLNQLALEMWERLGYREIDASVISRVLKAERLFTSKQLKIFCSILKLDSKLENLQEFLMIDAVSRFGLDREFIIKKSNFFIDLLEINLKQIRQLEKGCRPSLGLDWCECILDRIDQELSMVPENFQFTKLLELKGWFLLEKTEFLKLTELHSGMYKVLNTAHKAREIGEKLKDNNMAALSYYHIGDVHFIRGRYKECLPWYKKAVNSASEGLWGGIVMFDPLREASISLAYLGEKKEMESLEKKILDQRIHKYPRDLQCVIWQGLACAASVLKMHKKAEKFLGIAKRVFKEEIEKTVENHFAIRRIQIINADIELVKNREGSISGEIERIGKEGLNLTQRYGYYRHGEKIKNLLQDVSREERSSSDQNRVERFTISASRQSPLSLAQKEQPRG